MSRTILVTGGAGFIGSNFVHFVRRERPAWNIINLDALTYSGNPESLRDLKHDPHHRFIKGDVGDHTVVRTLVEQCDAVIHLAAESHVDRSIRDAAPFIRTNVLGTHVILEAARARGARMLFASTDEVYGSLPLDQPDQRFTEDAPIRPSSPYAASKAGADHLCRAYALTHAADVVVARCSNNFGPLQFPEKLIPLFITNLLVGRPLPLYGDGRNVRDWLHVEDHCEALLLLLERAAPGSVYNIGADNEHSNIELTRQILQILGKDESAITYVPDRPAHDRRYAIDASKIRRELGWRASRSSWPGSIESTVRWYQEHEDWWRPLRAKAGLA